MIGCRNHAAIRSQGRAMDSTWARLSGIRSSCLRNARRHLDSARLLASTANRGLAFHAALLALEETGKAVILMLRRRHEQEDEDGRLAKWADEIGIASWRGRE